MGRDIPILAHFDMHRATGYITLCGFAVLISVATPWYRWAAIGLPAFLAVPLAADFFGIKDRWAWLAVNGAYVLAWAAVIVAATRWIR